MGCSSCGTGSEKAPGCKSNGGCSSGSCNRMNVYDWLANLPFSDPESACRVVEVSFNNGSRKDYFRNSLCCSMNSTACRMCMPRSPELPTW